MTFAECARKNPNKLIKLIEVDILVKNDQWVNNGAGIWCVNLLGIYPWVDTSLLDGFSSLSINDIGSVCLSNTIFLQKVTQLSDLIGTGTFYFDNITKDLYICLPNYDSPYIYTNIKIGPLYGFIDKTFNPINNTAYYDNRIFSFPDVSFSRDPLFFGKISFGELSFTILNGDGQFDNFADANAIYGNPARIKIGFEELDISNYLTIYTGFVTNINMNEETFSFSIADRRKQLTKSVNYSCVNKNALEVIEELINTNYGIQYNSLLYNVTNWETMKLLVSNVTINTQEATPIIDLIELICNSIFGVFIIDADGKFDFKLIDPTLNPIGYINFEDILDPINIAYDSSQVISSTNIGYNKDWTKTTSSAYSWFNDTSNEDYVSNKYNVYIEKTVETILPDITSAQEYSSKLIEYNKDVHGKITTRVTIKYYEFEVGDFILLEVDRISKPVLYLRKCEILSKKYNLNEGTITLELRIMEELCVRITTDNKIRVLTDGNIRSGTI